jgi:tetratricopeptide (TPR) repeat protein
MIYSVLVTSAIIAVTLASDDTDKDRPELAVYQSAAAAARRDPDAHVRLALWCEAHGLTAERLKHLSLAVLSDPSHALARGLMGLVAYRGKWDRPEVVGQQIQNDPAHQAIIKDYLDRRTRTPDKADAQMKLAAWCAENGLHEQALAHYSLVIRLDPSREAAWRHLGYKKHGTRWVKPEEFAAAKQEVAQQKQADKHWKTKLEKLREGLISKDASKRSKADAGLKEVTDPRAVPMIWALFVRGDERHQIAAVQLLGQIDGPSASSGLAALAVFSPAAHVRSRALEILITRDPRDVVWRLIGLIHKPYKYQVRHVSGPGSPGELFVEGERFNIQRFYQNQTMTFALQQGRLFTPDIPFDPFSIRNLVLATFASQYAFAGSFKLGMPVGMGGLAPEFSVSTAPPLSGQSVAQAAQAIGANPTNAQSILRQLVSNPDNRTAPPAYWFMLMNQHVSTNPMHDAMTLSHQDRVANSPANRNANVNFDGTLMAQNQALQRDMQIAWELEAIRQANQNLEQRLAMDVQLVEATNAGINIYDDRALPVLKATTGQDLGVEPDKWKNWWSDQLGYAYQSDQPVAKPTYTDFVTDPVGVAHGACFAAGTLVQTIDGRQAIETIRVGDRVLSQETSTGQLSFQPVVATYRNQPTAMLRIAIGDEAIVATGIHRFWKAGKGWTMARELKAGDRLRMVGGVIEIGSVEASKLEPVYNLDVAENRDFFVGTKGLLVHDFSFVQPVLEPFDRQPELMSQASVSK